MLHSEPTFPVLTSFDSIEGRQLAPFVQRRLIRIDISLASLQAASMSRGSRCCFQCTQQATA